MITMNQKMLIEENLHGYYIFYGGRTKPWYNVNTERIAPEKAPVLRNLLSQLLNRDLNTPNSREKDIVKAKQEQLDAFLAGK